MRGQKSLVPNTRICVGKKYFRFPLLYYRVKVTIIFNMPAKLTFVRILLEHFPKIERKRRLKKTIDLENLNVSNKTEHKYNFIACTCK